MTRELLPPPDAPPLDEVDAELISLRRTVARVRQQGRALMVMGFVSGLVCGALLTILYGGL